MKSKVNKIFLSKEILNKKRLIFDTCYKSQTYVWEVLPDLMKYEFDVGPEIFTSD